MRFSALLYEGVLEGFIRNNANCYLAMLFYASALDTVLNPARTRQVPGELFQQLPPTHAKAFDGLLKIVSNGILLHTQQSNEA